MMSLEKKLYVTGIILIPVAILGWNLYLFFEEIDFIGPCIIYEKLGILCPGCGGIRAIKMLLQGRIISSIRFHPIVLYSVVVYSGFMISHTFAIFTDGKRKGLRFRSLYLYVALFIIIVNCILKNCMYCI